MADSGSTDSKAIYETLLAEFKAQAAVDEAIQKSIVNFVQSAEGEISKLVESNTLPPDVSAEMLQLHKAMIQKTIKLIKSNPIDGNPSD